MTSIPIQELIQFLIPQVQQFQSICSLIATLALHFHYLNTLLHRLISHEQTPKQPPHVIVIFIITVSFTILYYLTNPNNQYSIKCFSSIFQLNQL